MAKRRVKEIKWDLVENSEHFLREAVAYAGRDSPREWVFALVHLATALELSIKSILRQEHWSLLFDDVDSASREALKTGRFRSVGRREALRRTQEIAGVTLTEKDRKYMKRLQDLRNQVLHYEAALNIEQVKSMVARGLNIFNQFQLCACGGTVFNDGGGTDLTTIGQSVRTPVNSPTVMRPFNPFSTQPARGVNWDLNANFGTPLSALAFTSPRIFRFSVGLRF